MKEVDDLSKVKNKRGLRNYLKIHKGRKKFNKKTGGNSSLTLPNIISSVAAKSNNLNWNTIWDITVFQLFDAFERLQIIDQYDVFSTQVAVWETKKRNSSLELGVPIYMKKIKALNNQCFFCTKKKEVIDNG